jgi:hypothetical protein
VPVMATSRPITRVKGRRERGKTNPICVNFSNRVNPRQVVDGDKELSEEEGEKLFEKCASGGQSHLSPFSTS